MSPFSDWRIACPTIQDKNLRLLNSKIFSDVIFLVGDTKKPIHAHKFILIVSSPVFEVQFGERWEKEDEIEIPDISPIAFRMFLEFLYANKFEVTENEAADVLSLAHKYMINCLVKKCMELLESVINFSNVIHIHQIATKYSEENLEMVAMEFIQTNCNAVFESAGFLQIDTASLSRILKNDKLLMDEINIFHAVMRWAEKECKAEKLDCTVENKRLILKDLIPLIRFTLMTCEEFTNEVTIGKHEGILSDSESVAIFKYFISGELMRAQLPRLPFDVNRRYNGFLYKIDIHEPGGFDSFKRVNCRSDLTGSDVTACCEATIRFWSSQNICIKAIQLRRPRHQSTSTYLVFNDSGSPGSDGSAISAEISLSGIAHLEKRQRLSGTFVLSSFLNIDVDGGFKIEKNAKYKIRFVVKCVENGKLSPAHGMTVAKPARVSCQNDNVEINFTNVSYKCRPDLQEQESSRVKCICSGQIQTIHFTI